MCVWDWDDKVAQLILSIPLVDASKVFFFVIQGNLSVVFALSTTILKRDLVHDNVVSTPGNVTLERRSLTYWLDSLCNRANHDIVCLGPFLSLIGFLISSGKISTHSPPAPNILNPPIAYERYLETSFSPGLKVLTQ